LKSIRPSIGLTNKPRMRDGMQKLRKPFGSAQSTLRDAGVSRVAADPARFPGAEAPAGASRLAYFRWHGSPRLYYSKYPQSQISAFAALVNTNKAREAWCIFDNTALYAAWDDALAFMQAVPVTAD
jgi:uncharacterized protein YecE (DUF72 family)